MLHSEEANPDRGFFHGTNLRLQGRKKDSDSGQSPGSLPTPSPSPCALLYHPVFPEHSMLHTSMCKRWWLEFWNHPHSTPHPCFYVTMKGQQCGHCGHLSIRVSTEELVLICAAPGSAPPCGC